MVDPLASVVVSVTKFNAGFAHNVIPELPVLAGTLRALTQGVRDTGEQRVRRIAESIAGADGASRRMVWPQPSRYAQPSCGNRSRARRRGKGRLGRQGQCCDRSDHGQRGLFLHAACSSGRPQFHRRRRYCRLHNPTYDFNERRSHTGSPTASSLLKRCWRLREPATHADVRSEGFQRESRISRRRIAENWVARKGRRYVC